MMLNKVQRMWSRYARGGARHTTWKIRVPHIVLVLLATAGLLIGSCAAARSCWPASSPPR